MSLLKKLNFRDEKWLSDDPKTKQNVTSNKLNNNNYSDRLSNSLTTLEIKEWKDDKTEEIKLLLEWLQKQPHLPQNITEFQLLTFLHSCQYSLEKTKNKIENHFTIRTHAPELFTDRRLTSKDLKQALKMTRVAPLPCATPEGYNAIFIDCFNPDLANYNFVGCMKLAGAVVDVLVQMYPREDGNVLIFDMRNSLLAHMVKTNLATLKKVMMYVQTSLPCTLKQVHVVNAFPLIQQIETIMRPFINEDLRKIIHIHMQNKMETLYKFIPLKNLPSDYGGSADSVQCLNDEMLRIITSHEEYLTDMEKQVVDETKRTRCKTASDVFGMEGSFRKLDLD